MLPFPKSPSTRYRISRHACIVVLSLLLAACAPSGGDKSLSAATPGSSAPASASTILTGAATADWKRFHSHPWGFHIDYPDAWRASQSFGTSYFSTGTWKTYAATGSIGTPILALTLPGSNKVTTAQLRIGASADAQAVAHCLDLPPMASGGSDQQTLNGVSFLHFRASDAGMSHYVNVESYRTVHASRCYAIDLWIAGTRPQVYFPPATPPFTHDQAEKRLQSVLRTFHFQP